VSGGRPPPSVCSRPPQELSWGGRLTLFYYYFIVNMAQFEPFFSKKQRKSLELQAQNLNLWDDIVC
jgi:hypothetical protein